MVQKGAFSEDDKQALLRAYWIDTSFTLSSVLTAAYNPREGSIGEVINGSHRVVNNLVISLDILGGAVPPFFPRRYISDSAPGLS